ncbi:MAG: PP0621 family protein [Burkholderiales bacterium]
MAKFLLLVVVVAGVVLLLRNYQRTIARQQERDKAVAPADKAEDMIRCARCGVHLPKSESFLSRGQFYCSEEHRKLGASDGGRG